MKTKLHLFAAFCAAGILTMIPALGGTEDKGESVQWSPEIADKQIGLSCSSTSVVYGVPFAFDISLKSKKKSLRLYHHSPRRTHHIQCFAFRIYTRDSDGNEIRLHAPWPSGKKRIWRLPDRMILLDDNKNLWGILEVIDQSMKIRVYLAPTQADWSGSLWVEYVPHYWEHEKRLADKLRGLKSPEIKVAYDREDKPSNKLDAGDGK